ncbi:glycine zipper 2TM domain-containing protein [Paraburkholderia bonniea]|uniref:glycine zipper 2TM domain-containing protein n=1 Tax=Paraburkholderia bonniea TaxID=2152891 RepID=UPI001290F05A|nr:glycine zipper 2TM domain-containing protein [Paraburkholderia bonniea]WJF90747.1 glycine zipper 2TM domain-containing protein [Paraburkholderia bonniea]WJF94061.1 glycine zipper 2TM domain-containing protein [Paraburkholderia bonniea]
MKMTGRIFTAVVVVGSLVLSGCTNMSSGSVYSSSQAQREETVRTGTVESVRVVKLSSNDGHSSGLGLIGGGALGAVAGSALGGGRGKILTTIAGGLAGAVAGRAVENRASVSNGLEIVVRLDNGETRAVTQAADEAFSAGDRVRLLSSGGTTRVTH